jgi:hypothetical protein
MIEEPTQSVENWGIQLLAVSTFQQGNPRVAAQPA